MEIGSQLQREFGDEDVFWLWAKLPDGAITVLKLPPEPAPSELATALRTLADAVEGAILYFAYPDQFWSEGDAVSNSFRHASVAEPSQRSEP